MPQYTWQPPMPYFDRNDFLFSDVRDALWKDLTTQGIHSITVGYTTTIYHLTFTVTGIEPNEQISLTDNYGRAWTVPAWPWTAFGA